MACAWRVHGVCAGVIACACRCTCHVQAGTHGVCVPVGVPHACRRALHACRALRVRASVPRARRRAHADTRIVHAVHVRAGVYHARAGVRMQACIACACRYRYHAHAGMPRVCVPVSVCIVCVHCVCMQVTVCACPCACITCACRCTYHALSVRAGVYRACASCACRRASRALTRAHRCVSSRFPPPSTHRSRRHGRCPLRPPSPSPRRAGGAGEARFLPYLGLRAAATRRLPTPPLRPHRHRQPKQASPRRAVPCGAVRWHGVPWAGVMPGRERRCQRATGAAALTLPPRSLGGGRLRSGTDARVPNRGGGPPLWPPQSIPQPQLCP